MKPNNIDEQTTIYGADFPDILMGSSKDILSTHAEYPGGLVYPPHSHPPGQLLFASQGVLTVVTEKGRWIVPESHAVWIPPMLEHRIQCKQHLVLRNLYIKPYASQSLPKGCCVVTITPLLRELIVYTSDFSSKYNQNSHESRTMMVMLDLLTKLKSVPLSLPSPADKRLQKITEHLIANPASKKKLSQWADHAGVSTRTLSRSFVKQTGMTFVQWRQRAKCMDALTRLTNNEQVSTVAYDLGYNSVSAFIASFKRQFGSTPGIYSKSFK